MKIAAVCCTYLRPEALGQMVRCFERQDYPDRELIILDDAGQYEHPPHGDRWRLHSTRTRFATLGQKRNAAAGLISEDTDAIAVWDDDDLYLPWALRASVAALKTADWSRPSVVLHPHADGRLRQHETGGLFHGGWAYRTAAFDRTGGYPDMNNGEDRRLARRFDRANTTQADPIALGWEPFYVYPWGTSQGWHLSGMGNDGYRRLAGLRAQTTQLTVTDPPHLDLRNPTIEPGIHPRVF